MPNKSIFSFFSPKPKASGEKKASTPLKQINTSTPKAESTCKFNLGDLVWAKLDGYPWWPGLVCKDQALGKCFKGNSKKEVHVQFFDDPVSRAWILETHCKSYHGTKSKECEPGGVFFNSVNNYDVKVAMDKADKVLNAPLNERMDLIVVQQKEENNENLFEEFAENKHDVPAKKRRRIITDSDDDELMESEEEYVPSNSNEESEKDDLSVVSEKSLSAPDSESEPEDSPVKGTKKRKMSQKTPNSNTMKKTNNTFTPSVSNKTVSRLSLFQANDSSNTQPEVNPETRYLHETLDFLQPKLIMDVYKHRPGHEKYNPCTLHIPDSFFNSLTPGMYQWWKIKQKNFDVILFFKVGKFYELYHMDAVVGVQELGLIYMKGKFAHSGFPEISFGRYSDALVQRGFKVARVEQTETPDQNSQRIKGRNLPKHEKTLRREVCRIITPGTQMLNTWSTIGSMTNTNNYLLAICDKNETLLDNKTVPVFGVCFIDTSIGVFHIGQFSDDRHLSHLRTMLANYTPCHVLCDKSKISKSISKILKTGLASALQENMVFWDAEKTLKNISSSKYFVKGGEENWPDIIKSMLSDSDSLGLTPAVGSELALSALGACIFYLRKCLIDYEVMSMKQFEKYKPVLSVHIDTKADFKPLQKLVLDSVSLSNLEILGNSVGESEGSLLFALDHCQSPFGKRLLKQWVCAPPCNPDVIHSRLDAMGDLMGNEEFVKEVRECVKKMVDLERLLMKIHCFSKGAKLETHPDNRAILYDEIKYSKRKIEDFLNILYSYESYFNILEHHQNLVQKFKSQLLINICQFESDKNSSGQFPNMAAVLQKWKKAFNHAKAKENGKIVPNKGTNPEYDDAVNDIESINEKLDEYLQMQKKKLQCSKITYKGSGNKRFQIEVPIDVANRGTLAEYTISGQRKGFKSFRTKETCLFLKEMENAEGRRDAAQAETMAIVFREFDKDYEMWNKAIQCISTFDVLASMAIFCKSHDTICKPEIILADEPFLEIENAKHPCISKTYSGGDFIPNDTFLGKCSDSSAGCMVLTGPNMGGKSTLMRQVGLIVTLAHLGCYVPAERCKLTPVDRIFTRLGASDRILSGESTFFVELSETSSILKHATKHSLVLLDELGRGTATYDGTAIASAVAREMADSIKCRTIFSTHYHTLVEDFKNNPGIKLGHMSCMVETDDINEHCGKESITFLYKLAKGACPKSYGFHAARLADVPEDVITLAVKKSAEMEQKTTNMKTFYSSIKM